MNLPKSILKDVPKIDEQLRSNFNAESTKIISMIQKEKTLIDSYMTLDRINKIRKKC